MGGLYITILNPVFTRSRLERWLLARFSTSEETICTRSGVRVTPSAGAKRRRALGRSLARDFEFNVSIARSAEHQGSHCSKLLLVVLASELFHIIWRKVIDISCYWNACFLLYVAEPSDEPIKKSIILHRLFDESRTHRMRVC